MTAFARRALVDHKLMEANRARPAYQRNDDLAWIKRAKRAETRAKQFTQRSRNLNAATVAWAWRFAAPACVEDGPTARPPAPRVQ